MREDMIRFYKSLYDFENWNMNSAEEAGGFRAFSPHLAEEDAYSRVSQEVSAPMWGESLYTHNEVLQKGGVLFQVKLWPYYTVQKAKEGMLERMVASVPFEKAGDIHIGDLCYTHPSHPNAYLLLLSSKTMIEISADDDGDHMEDIKELASMIVAQMADVRNRMPGGMSL